MKTLHTILGLSIVAACKGGAARETAGSATPPTLDAAAIAPVVEEPMPTSTLPPPGKPVQSRLPKVDGNDVTVLPVATDRVPLVVFVESDGKVQIASGPTSWTELAAFDPAADQLHVLDLETLGRRVREKTIFGRSTREIATDLRRKDPPPAPTTILARAPTARMTRGRSGLRYIEGDTDSWHRLTQVVGEVVESQRLIAPQSAVVVARPDAPARTLVDALAATEGALLVLHADKVVPLRLQFARDPSGLLDAGDGPWIEVRVTQKAVDVETVPDVPISVPARDPAALAKAYQTSIMKPHYGDHVPVDVLVAGDLDVQHVVDVLVALDRAGARTIALGHLPQDPTAMMKVRGKIRARVSVGQPSASGDLDKSVIRAAVRATADKVNDCYARALVRKPKLSGTVMVSFLITGTGKVQIASGNGVDPEVASCVANVIKAIEFPAPRNGGNVQVNYPFTLRPTW